jgi:hypothetical protein
MTHYLVHDTGPDDPTETRRFPYETEEEAKAQMKHEVDRGADKKQFKVVEETE